VDQQGQRQIDDEHRGQSECRAGRRCQRDHICLAEFDQFLRHLVDVDDAGADKAQHQPAHDGTGAERHDQRDHLEAMDDETVESAKQQADQRCRHKRNEHAVIAEIDHGADGQIHGCDGKGGE